MKNKMGLKLISTNFLIILFKCEPECPKAVVLNDSIMGTISESDILYLGMICNMLGLYHATAIYGVIIVMQQPLQTR